MRDYGWCMTNKTDSESSGWRSSDSPFIARDRSWVTQVNGMLVQWQPDGFPACEAVLTNTRGELQQVSLPGARMVRLGGAHEADKAVHLSLILVLGAIILASGHVELEMKRVLLKAKAIPDADFSDVDYSWKGLEERLESVVREGGEIAEKLGPVLTWAQERHLRQRRNDAVHSSWSLYEVGHFQGARLAPNSDGHTIVDDGGHLSETASLLREYVNRLQQVVKWPVLVLPPLQEDVPIRRPRLVIAEEPGRT